MEGNTEEQHKNKALLFQLAVSNSFKLISESVSKDEFCAALTILNSKRKQLPKLHDAMREELYDSLKNDLESVLNDGCLKEALAKVSELAEKTDIPEYEIAWRPPGNIHLHLRSFDAEIIVEESQSLEREVTELESENASLMKEIAEKRSKIRTMKSNMAQSLKRCPLAHKHVEERLNELEKALKILQGG